MSLSQGLRRQVLKNLRLVLSFEMRSTSRNIHATRHVLRFSKPAPSPKLRGPPIRDRISPKGISAHEIEGSLPSMKSLTQAFMNQDLSHDPQVIRAFLRDHIVQWNEHKGDGKWQEQLCEKYSQRPEDLYSLARHLFSTQHAAPTSTQGRLFTQLLFLASRQGHVGASIALVVGSPRMRRDIEFDSAIFKNIENAAIGGNQQAMTVLAIILNSRKMNKDSMRWLERALGWPSVMTSRPLTKSGSNKPTTASPSLPKLEANSSTKPPEISAQTLSLKFPGANEALRLLAQLYLNLHTASASNSTTYNSPTTKQTSRPAKQKTDKAAEAPADYLALAKTAFTIAAVDLEDAHSYTHLIPLLDTADPMRGPLLLRAAASGNEFAWKELAGLKPVSEIDQDNSEKLVKPAPGSVQAVREVNKLLGNPQLWREEWEALQIHWQALSDHSEPAS